MSDDIVTSWKKSKETPDIWKRATAKNGNEQLFAFIRTNSISETFALFNKISQIIATSPGHEHASISLSNESMVIMLNALGEEDSLHNSLELSRKISAALQK